MSSLNYDANKLPLGKLSKATIMRGFQQLKELAALIDDPSLPGNKEQLSNTFYSLIPHAFGRNRPPIISDSALLKKEIELLESLSDMKDAADIMKIDRKTVDTVHPLDRQFQGLGLNEMTTLDHSSVEFNSLKDYLCESRGATHNFDYKVEQIWRIERQGEKDRFDQSEYAKIDSDRRLLWHGSRCTNFGGILSQGLRIAPPEAPVSGYMFGKGIYLADMSSKSAGYCCSYISNGHILLLLCEAELGNPMQTLTQASYQAGETAKQNGMVSTWGQGSTGPSKWVDAGTVHESLKGIKMVSRLCLCFFLFLAFDLTSVYHPFTLSYFAITNTPFPHSPTQTSRPAQPTSRTPAFTTTSTSVMTLLRSVFDISSASRCKVHLRRWHLSRCLDD
jgi:poly [ADP-ribose] polymerase